MNQNRKYTPARPVTAPRLRDAGGLLRQVPLRYMGYAEIPMRDADGFIRTHTAHIPVDLIRAATRDPRRFPCGDADGPMRPAHHS